MTRYLALLRGIGPTNPNMRNENLRRVCEDLGLNNVRTVISSGNVLFETEATDVADLEATLEMAWPAKLGFESTTIIRSRDELENLIQLRPYEELEHGPTSYLLVTFSKNPLTIDWEFPYQPKGKDYSFLTRTERELFNVSDTTSLRTPDVMAWLEQQLGKQITSRTWLTVSRILKKMVG